MADEIEVHVRKVQPLIPNEWAKELQARVDREAEVFGRFLTPEARKRVDAALAEAERKALGL